MPSSVQRAAAVGVLVLSILAVAYLALRAFGVPVGVANGPAPSSTASSHPPDAPSASPGQSPAGPEAPSATDDAAIAAALARIEEEVREVRQLPDADVGAPELLTRDELAAELAAVFAEEYPPEEREADNVTLRALGLLEEGQDVGELQQRLLTDQVLGFYDDRDRRMVIVSDAGLDSLARITYAHEYTHALQDAAFGLAALELEAVGEDDRTLARLALVEGDATVTMFFWALQFAPDVMGEVQETPVPDTAGVPRWMLDTLEFPYLAGATFVAQLWTTADAGAVDAVYAEPPASTEQIIHYDKYVAGEAPIEIPGLDLAAALGDGWTGVESTPMGEAQIAIILEYLGARPDEATNAAAGWGGDRLTVARRAAGRADGPDGADVALVWRLAWDRPADAMQFVEAYAGIGDAIPMVTAVEQLTAAEVLVVHASSQQVLEAALSAAGG